MLAQFFRNQARYRVGGSARWKWNNYNDWLSWICGITVFCHRARRADGKSKPQSDGGYPQVSHITLPACVAYLCQVVPLMPVQYVDREPCRAACQDDPV